MKQLHDSFDAFRSGFGRSDGKPTTQAVKDALEVLAAAKADIDQLAEMLHYFTSLGDSRQLRDYREVRENLTRSRALLATQPDLARRLAESVSSLGRLFGLETPIPLGPSGAAEQRATGWPRDAETVAPASPGEQPSAPQPPAETAPAPTEAGSGSTEDQKIASSVFSEIEEILSRPS